MFPPLSITFTRPHLLASLFAVAIAWPLFGFAVLYVAASIVPASDSAILFGGLTMAAFYLPTMSLVNHLGGSGNMGYFLGALLFWWSVSVAIWFSVGGRIVRSHEAL